MSKQRKAMRAVNLSAGSSLIALLMASPAIAQNAEMQPSAVVTEATPQASGGLEDIVVTARKRSENQRDVPASIQSLTGEQLVRANAVSLIDIAVKTPSFSIAYGSISPFTFVRGFGSGSSPSFDQAVGKFVDNISFGRDQDGRLPIFDIERFEVLKGPQVLVFGNSTTAGALNITTKKPGDSFSADGSVSYEFNNNEVLTQGGVTVPISSGVSFRLAGLYRNLAKGWMSNVATGTDDPRTDTWALRPSLRITPTTDLEINLKAEFDNVRDDGGLLQPFRQTRSPGFVFPEIALDDTRNVSNQDGPFFNHDFARMVAQTYQGDLNYRVLGGTLVLTTGYRRFHFTQSVDGDALPVPVFNAFLQQHYRQFSQEVRFSGSSGPLEYTLGGFYERDDLSIFSFQNFNLAALGVPAPPFARLNQFRQITNTYSGFGDLTYHITDKLSIEAGLRYSKTRKSASQSSNPADIIPGLDENITLAQALAARNPIYTPVYQQISGTPHDFTGLEATEDHFQPQVVLQYKINPLTQVYAKWVRGAKAGGFDWIFSGSNPALARFAPEKAESFEAGIKGRTANNRVDFALSLFRTTFTDLQNSIFDGASTFVIANVGKARTQGAELELNWAPVDGLKINASGAYLDAKYLSFPGASCYFGQPSTQCVGRAQDLSGTTTQYASKWAGALSVSYETPIGGDHVLGGGFSIAARSKFNAGSQNDPIDVQKGYAQIDAHIELRPDNGWWSLTLFGKNLTDKQYFDFSSPAIPSTGGEMGSISRGRQLGVRLGANF